MTSPDRPAPRAAFALALATPAISPGPLSRAHVKLGGSGRCRSCHAEHAAKPATGLDDACFAHQRTALSTTCRGGHGPSGQPAGGGRP